MIGACLCSICGASVGFLAAGLLVLTMGNGEELLALGALMTAAGAIAGAIVGCAAEKRQAARRKTGGV